MEPGVYEKALKASMRMLCILLIFGTMCFLFFVGLEMFLFLINGMGPGEDINAVAMLIVTFLVVFSLFVVFPFVYLFKQKKMQTRMVNFNIGDFEIQNFEAEYQRSHDTVGAMNLTENWLFFRMIGYTCVLPLKEIVWVRLMYHGGRRSSGYYIDIFFSDKSILSYRDSEMNHKKLIAMLTVRCPHALVGYSDERDAAWKDDYMQIVRASRKKAIEIERMARAEREAEETSDAPALPPDGGSVSLDL